jgi:hypothetical protein
LPTPRLSHLQGCYADLDGLASTRAVLRRAAGESGAEGL